MFEGSKLHESWSAALTQAQSRFRSLLLSSSSPSWKRVPIPQSESSAASAAPLSNPSPKGKGRARFTDNADIAMHRRSSKEGDVLRVVLDINLDGDDNALASMDIWKAVLATPEMRKEWDPSVEGAHMVEMFDPNTVIAKTDFTFGWPANPRDAITIARTYSDTTTLIAISTSLPRSPDEPAYLRPAPPYVRSHVHLFAWCVQIIQPAPLPVDDGSNLGLYTSPTTGSGPTKLRVTCFWNHDLMTVWGIGGGALLPHNLPTMVIGLVKTVRKRGNRIPLVSGYGIGIGIEHVVFDSGRDTLKIEYAVSSEDEEEENLVGMRGMDDLQVVKERRRLERSVECSLPGLFGWDTRISTRASLPDVASLPWSVYASRTPSSPTAVATRPSESHIVFRLSHPRPPPHAILKVKIVIELSGGTSGLRLNGLPHAVSMTESRDPSSFTISRQMLADAESVSQLTIDTNESGSGKGVGGPGAGGTVASSAASGSASTHQNPFLRSATERTPAAEKAILTLVRRNYIYFTSLLQEPEAKWSRPVTEARGVTVTQLDSIDPTLVVYRAQAVFVGVGVWDLLSTISTPGARTHWDKGHEDATLLEDVNELTELWHWKTRAAWPVNARDTVLLKTSYKSPTSVHVFSFSTDDTQLFPSIPTQDPSVIRTQVDLQGWAIEALSPTTTLLTLLEQSDPKGWSNKSSIPQQMIAAVAGVGEFAIKCGGPPIATRVGAAKVLGMRYDHEKGSFKVEYEGSERRRGESTNRAWGKVNGQIKSPSESATPSDARSSSRDSTDSLDSSSLDAASGGRSGAGAVSVKAKSMPMIECELRCDSDTWSSSIELVIDPPPQSVSCLRRHRLLSGGGGLWITIEHDAVFVGDDRLTVIVRKGLSTSGRGERGVVVVNGARAKVDVEDLSEQEVKLLTKMKRVKPVRIPLDQPPVLNAIRRRRTEWEEADSDENDGNSKSGSVWAPSAPRFTNPITRLFSIATDQALSTTTAAAAAVAPGAGPTPAAVAASTPAVASSATSSTLATPSASDPGWDTHPPIKNALGAISYLRALHTQSQRSASTTEGWTLASGKGNFPVHKKIEPSISPTIPVHKGSKVIEGVSAEEVAAVVSNYDGRKQWDEWFDSGIVLEEYGGGCHTAFITTKSGFPFRDRGFYVATVKARLGTAAVARSRSRSAGPGGRSPSTEDGTATPTSSPTVIFCASASYATTPKGNFSATKCNPQVLPVGRLHIQGWILETLDPYTEENYAIPSTRCTQVVAVDYAGSVPVTYNSMVNSSFPKSIVALEEYLKGRAHAPLVRLPAAGVMLAPWSSEDTTPGKTEKDGVGWSLERYDTERLLLSSVYTPGNQSFRSQVLVNPRALEPEQPPPSAASSSTSTPRPSRLPSSTGSFNQSQADVQTPSLPSPAYPSRRVTSITPRDPSASSSSSALNTFPRRNRVRSVSASLSPGSGMEAIHGIDDDDFLVCEVVVDSKLFPAGYDIKLATASRSDDEGCQEASTSKASSLALGPLSDAWSKTIIPVETNLYTFPPSALLSGSLTSSAPRHLLRFTIPTSTYTTPPIDDPLTGETRRAPTKPPWLLDIEKNGGVVEVSIAPAGGRAGKTKVSVNGVPVDVASEKKSLAALGKSELENEKLEMWSLLNRAPRAGDSKLLPQELMEPVAVARHLCADEVKKVAPAPAPIPTQDDKATGQKADQTKDDASTVSMQGEASPDKPPAPLLTQTAANSIMTFFTTYPFAASRTSLTAAAEPDDPKTSAAPAEDGSQKSSAADDAKTDPPEQGPVNATAPAAAPSDSENSPAVRARRILHAPVYSLWALLIVALISFLLGSLLRSLLSPADFIYVSDNSGRAEAQAAGWREVKRLVEVKYILGGWDFVIAVVRRP
ncbi:hypothetical protein BOTBODRAFT_126512 [Botryobasidium botryosum FD-172 SS1]|uniref:START domain-containing protein n=1 Tax=Botryobasidium botryosum (strain FD-172 SS1) TaxID=930990 RepID=A0A067MVI5_BOTB1|nr:hypothetical protein BOTBODRAFT_126512 [Botryobasidium botryosum FD-172 SS1]